MLPVQLALFEEDPAIRIAKQRKQLRNLITALSFEGFTHRECWNLIYSELNTLHSVDLKAAAENFCKLMGKKITPIDFVEAHGWITEAIDVATMLLRAARQQKAN